MRDRVLQGRRWKRLNDFGVRCTAAKRPARKTRSRKFYQRPRAGKKDWLL